MILSVDKYYYQSLTLTVSGPLVDYQEGAGVRCFYANLDKLAFL